METPTTPRPKNWGRKLPIIPVVIAIVIVNSKLLKGHLKAKRRATAYSRALRQIRGVFQRIVRGRLRSVFQRVRECVKSEVFSNEYPVSTGIGPQSLPEWAFRER